MKRILAALSVAAVLSAPAMAQTAGTTPPTATLTVDGTGTVTATPDIVIVQIGVTTRGDTPAEALAANSTDMQSVIDAVRNAGLEDRDIATSNFNIYPVYSQQEPARDVQPARIIGYEVTNQVTVKIRDIENSGTIIDQVVAAGANQINSIRFDIEDPQPLQDEALGKAIEEARRQAELMAAAAGVELVRILSVSTRADSPVAYDRVQFAAAAQAAPPPPILGGEQAVTATATLVFEIAPLE